MTEVEQAAHFFRALVEHLVDLVLVIDRNGDVTYTNESDLAATVGSEVAADAPGFFELIHPDDRLLVDEAISNALARPGPTTPVELRAAGDDGWRLLELVAVNLLDDPVVAGVVIAVRDLTGRRHLEGEVADRPERLRALLNSSTDLTMLADAEGTIRYSSTVSQRLLGMEPAELSGQRLTSIAHVDSLPVLSDAWAELLRAPSQRVTCDIAVTRADGSAGVLALNLANFLDDPTVEGVVVSGRDVTELRRTERLLDHFGQQFETSPHGLARIDATGRFHEVNQALRGLSGRSEPELLTTNLAAVVHPDDADVINEFLAGTSESTPADLRLLRPDGSELWVRLTPTLLHDFDGERLMSVQIDDINDRKRLEETLRERNAALAYRATHDALTGLPNRQLFVDRVGHALDRSLRHHTTVAILFCDLDQFKQVNDTFGHAVGDQLLMAVSEQMARALRPGDTISRFSGDEFVVLAEDLEGSDDASALANRLLRIMSQPLEVGGRRIATGMSIGVAVATGIDDPTALITAADAAMYRAKRAGRGCYRLAPLPPDR